MHTADDVPPPTTTTPALRKAQTVKMKINCCCFWCVCGEDADDKNLEQSKLLDNEHLGKSGSKQHVNSPATAAPAAAATACNEAAKTTAASPKNDRKPSSGAAATEAGDSSAIAASSTSQTADKKELSPQEKDEKRQKVVGKFRNKIRIVNQLSRITSSAYLDHRPLALSIELKIDLKVFPASECLKVFAVSAYGVSASALDESTGGNGDETPSPSEPEPIVLQLRTKVTPQEARGHSKKYTLKENVLDSVKFSNECLHTLSTDDLGDSQLRLRLYRLHKQRRDRLLGEYTLVLARLDISPSDSGVSSVSMQLHDVDVTPEQPPKVRKVSGGDSFSAHRGTTRRSETSKASSVSSSRRCQSASSVSEGFRNRLFSSVTSSSDTERGAGGGTEERSGTEAPPNSAAADAVTSFSALHSAFRERLDRVSEMEERTEEMRDRASNFQEVSRKLTEKYRQKCHGK